MEKNGEKIVNPAAKGRETSEFLMAIVRTLSTSADFEQREKEKARIEKTFTQSDKRLGELVSENYQDLAQITQDFSTISKSVNEAREKIKKIKDDLSSCKTLLHCKRDELRRLWIEGVEQKTMVAMLDQIEQIKEVPTKLDNLLLKKHYLHGTELVVNAVAKLENQLVGVEALRDLKAELITRKEQLHEVLIDELNKQIYIKSQSPNFSSLQGKKSSTAQKQDNLKRKGVNGIPPPEKMEFGKEVKEDLNSNPEDDPTHFMAILVESLYMLRKIPEAAEGLKVRIQPELSAIVARTSQHILESTSNHVDSSNQSQCLLDLLENIFHQFRFVAHMHKVVLRNLHRIITTGSRREVSGVPVRQECLYDMTDVWSKIQAVVELLLREYLDVENTSSSRQRAPSSFDEPSTDINSFFAKKRPAKPKKMALFRFDASIHAISTNSYVDDSRAFDTGDLFSSSLLAEMGLEKNQMVCKPSVYNITAIFKPLELFIREIEDAIACPDGRSSLQAFVTDFVQNIFLGQVHYTVSTSIGSATKDLIRYYKNPQSFDALRHVVDHKIQKELGVIKPLLTSTVTVDKNLQELRELMQDLPDYADQFLNMICNTLKEYRDTCHSAYREIVQYDSDERRVISAMWAKDEDISRFLSFSYEVRSLPSWRSLQSASGQELASEDVCSEEEIKALNSKEAQILISNLTSSDAMIQQEIITDVTQMRTIANVHESLEWFSNRMKDFSNCLSARSATTAADIAASEYPPVSEKTLSSLKNLVKDFQDLAEICLLLLHLEVRVHCFYFLLPVAKQSNYAGPIDDLDPDSNVLKLNKDLSSMEEVLQQSLQPKKFRYIFESLGFLVASILMNSIQYMKKINENGIKKMCRNLFAIQQNLTNITMSREADLDHARQYYELLYINPDDVITMIAEKGGRYTFQEYTELVKLHHRSHAALSPSQLERRMQKLKEVFFKTPNGECDP
ncbi:exocyst complex component 4-like isoform X3 [Ostrea edulis]|uniref:exocyst complex component 4-like isoform X3 n=1 Tax=Ostrea edulis TaxID=37623 RepID=UPI0024AFF08F|nr:exocyst complex component 4-like isoform X3 [Ostrea edulis]